MINWDLWNQAGQKLQNETRDLYDFSWVTPEVVKGFTRYQALRPEAEIKESDEYKKTLDAITDDDALALFKYKKAYGPKLNEYLENKDYLNKGYLKPEANNVPAGEMSVGTRPMTGGHAALEVAARPDEIREKEFEKDFIESEWANIDKADKAALKEELLKERLGNRYNSMKRSYDIYGKLNPYERMIEAGKRSSYWDPEIGKIYTDAGEKIRQNNLDIWKAAQENRLNLLKLAQQRLDSPYVRGSDLRTIRQLTNELSDLAKQDPRGGGWYTADGNQKTLDQYRADNMKMSDGSGNTIDEVDFYAKLRRGDIYKTLTDLRADAYYKAADPEEQALIEQEWNKNRNTFIENQKVKNEKIMAAVKTTPYGDELDSSQKLLNKLKMINFDNPNKNYMGMQILGAMKDAGYDVDRVLDADPTMRSIRAKLKDAKDKDWATILKENPDIGDLVVEGVAKTIFPMLRSQNVWEGNEDAIKTFGQLLLADTENRYNAAREGARGMLTGWEGTFLDDRFDDWYKPKGAPASAPAPVENDGQGGENKDDDKKDTKSNGFETAFPTLKGMAPTIDNIEPVNDTTKGLIKTYLKNPSQFKLDEDGNGRPILVWKGQNYVNVMTFIDGKWVALATPVDKEKKTPVKPTTPVQTPDTPATMPEGGL